MVDQVDIQEAWWNYRKNETILGAWEVCHQKFQVRGQQEERVEGSQHGLLSCREVSVILACGTGGTQKFPPSCLTGTAREIPLD